MPRFLPPFVFAGLDPAIQICFRAAHRNLDHRVSTLRVGPVMTEKNQSEAKSGIKLRTIFVPDSRVPSTTMRKWCE
jgi:hypothetical protein